MGEIDQASEPRYGNEDSMADRQLTKRSLLLRQRAARAMEKSLPDQVRRAYGDAPGLLADLASDDPHLVTVRENARAWLLKQGYLTEEELDTLPVEEAIVTAQERLRAQAAGLREQSDMLARQEKSNPDRFTRAPRSLRQG